MKDLVSMKNLFHYLNKVWVLKDPIKVSILSLVFFMLSILLTDLWIILELMLKRFKFQNLSEPVSNIKCGLKLYFCIPNMVNLIKPLSQWWIIHQLLGNTTLSLTILLRFQIMIYTTKQWSSILKKSQCSWMTSSDSLLWKLMQQNACKSWRELDILL